MGNIIHSASFASIAKAVGTSEQSSAPAREVIDYVHPYRVWRATDCASGSTRIYVDFGVATPLVAVAAFNLNVTSVKAQHSSDASSWSDDHTVTVAKDAIEQSYKFYQTLTAWNYRYLGILANTSTTTDSTSSMQVGAIVGITAITTWTDNPGFPYGIVPLRATVQNDDFDSGGREPIVTGNNHAQLSLAGAPMRLSMAATVNTILGSYGNHTPFLYYRNNSDTSEVYMVRRVGNADWSQAGPNHLQLGSLLLESMA